ncbi:MAG: DNA starvation/stationary phase protection protein [Parvularcula sp.]|nr:DNA starvation/stationary phase protection protein [Parvularcula sp.]
MTDINRRAEALKGILGDLYSLYMRTHGYHWNVEGPNFKPLHELFEENYRAIWESLDDVAERIRALGVYAPMGGAAIASASRLESVDNDVPSAEAMVQNLIAGHEGFVRHATDALSFFADDPASDGLITDLISQHEKMAWMLRSSLPR